MKRSSAGKFLAIFVAAAAALFIAVRVVSPPARMEIARPAAVPSHGDQAARTDPASDSSGRDASLDEFEPEDPCRAPSEAPDEGMSATARRLCAGRVNCLVLLAGPESGLVPPPDAIVPGRTAPGDTRGEQRSLPARAADEVKEQR